MHTLLRRLSVVGFSVALLAATGCERTPNAGAAPQPMPVTVSKPLVREVTDFEERQGRTEAVETVEIRARVSGFLDKVTFQRLKQSAPKSPEAMKLAEGQEVPAGTLLFEIDPRPYVAARAAASAEVERSKATQLQLAADKRRADELKASNNISQQEYDKILGSFAEAEANVKAAQAKLESADLNLGFTKVTAPITGRLGVALVTEGNLVTADVTPLTTIVREDPIYVYFELPEQTLLRYQKLIRENKFASARDNDLPVWMELSNEKGFPHAGFIDFVDNMIDKETGTLRLRGVFANPSLVQHLRQFTPGIFVRVRIPASQPYEALLVTDRAITVSLGAKVVFVIDAEGVAHRREVTLGSVHDGLRVITSGLTAADRIVVNGVQRVRDGAKVAATDVPTMPGLATPAAAATGTAAPAGTPLPTSTGNSK